MATLKEIAEKYFEQPGWKPPEQRSSSPAAPTPEGPLLTPAFTSVAVNKTQSVYTVYTSDWNALTENGQKKPSEDEILEALDKRKLRCTRVY